MTLNENEAAGFAKELMMALAQSESLKLRGSGSTQTIEGSTNAGERDAAYLSSLYQSLVSGLQK